MDGDSPGVRSGAGVVQEMKTNTCEWSGEKKSGNAVCPNAAEWQHVFTDVRRHATVWRLCDGHKRMLLNGYNEEWRAKEAPEWTRIGLAEEFFL